MLDHVKKVYLLFPSLHGDILWHGCCSQLGCFIGCVEMVKVKLSEAWSLNLILDSIFVFCKLLSQSIERGPKRYGKLPPTMILGQAMWGGACPGRRDRLAGGESCGT